jgi:hypothetical protein
MMEELRAPRLVYRLAVSIIKIEGQISEKNFAQLNASMFIWMRMGEKPSIKAWQSRKQVNNRIVHPFLQEEVPI